MGGLGGKIGGNASLTEGGIDAPDIWNILKAYLKSGYKSFTEV